MNPPPSAHRKFLILILLWIPVYLLNLDAFELGSEEARRIYPAQTMLASGDWLNPVYAGELYNRKPPLFNWLIAIALSLGSRAREIAVHLPGACSLLPVLAWLAYAPSGWLHGRARWLAALLFISSLAFYRESRSVMIDAPYAAATALALLAWLDAWSLGKRGLRLWLPSGLFLGFAMLLKGPAALLLFYLTVFFICRASSSLRLLLHWSHAVGLGFALGLFGLWFWARISHPPAFATDAAVLQDQMLHTWWTELSQRYLKSSESGGPFSPLGWFKGVYGALLVLLPWLLILPRLWQSDWNRHPSAATQSIIRGGRIALLVFAAVIFLMPMTRARYFLPAQALIVPFTALILCQDWLKLSEKILPIWTHLLRWVPRLLALLSLLAAIAIFSGELRQRLDLHWGHSLGLILLAGCLLWGPKKIPLGTSTDGLATATGFLLIASYIFSNLFGQQVSQSLQGESRAAASQLMRAIPTGERVCFVNVPATPAYLFYLQDHAQLNFLQIDKNGAEYGDMGTYSSPKLDDQALRKILRETSFFVTAKKRSAKNDSVEITAESLTRLCGRSCRAVLVFPFDKKQITVFSCKTE